MDEDEGTSVDQAKSPFAEFVVDAVAVVDENILRKLVSLVLSQNLERLQPSS
jgi:hypothetical protein